MIDKNVVKKLVDEWLQDQEYFLVDIEISPDNRIVERLTTLTVYGLRIVWL